MPAYLELTRSPCVGSAAWSRSVPGASVPPRNCRYRLPKQYQCPMASKHISHCSAASSSAVLSEVGDEAASAVVSASAMPGAPSMLRRAGDTHRAIARPWCGTGYSYAELDL